MSRDPHPWASRLETLYAQVWTCLIRGVHDRRAPARHPTLATVSERGLPQARTVVLRHVDRLACSLDIHTDIHSAKVAELRTTPFAALHVWDGAAHLQLRLEAEVAILSGPEIIDIWARVPEPSRLSYGSEPAPGQPIASALDYVKSPHPADFAVLRSKINVIDVLHLGDTHRRARFDRQDKWQGQWLAP